MIRQFLVLAAFGAAQPLVVKDNLRLDWHRGA